MHKNIATIVDSSLLVLVYSTSAIAGLQPFYELLEDDYHRGYKKRQNLIL